MKKIFNLRNNVILLTLFCCIFAIILFFDLENVNKECWVFINIIDPLCDIIKKSNDNSFWGTFGDFFGGVIGTILTLISVIYVVKTFREQQKEAKTQRFNDMFFELLRVYQEQVEELCIKGKDGKEYCGKEFFEYGQRDISNKVTDALDKLNRNSYYIRDFVLLKNTKKIDFAKLNRISYYIREIVLLKNSYSPFYLENRSKLAPYFRTLYRMFEVLENNEKLLGNKVKEYAKIIRAQLSESELFFIRYNAYSFYGENLQKHINKYNLLKHLPVFELVEFKNVCDNDNIGIKSENSESINAIYYDIRKTLKDILYNSNQKYKLGTSKLIELSKFTEKHKLFITLQEKYKIEFKYTMDKSVKKITHPNFNFFDNLNQSQKNILLGLFINELFFDSNFSEFNKRISKGEGVEIKEYSNNNENQIIITIENKNRKPLRLKKV